MITGEFWHLHDDDMLGWIDAAAVRLLVHVGCRIEHGSIQVKLIRIGAKVIHHARYIIFQMAEVAVPRELFAQILQRIWALVPDAG